MPPRVLWRTAGGEGELPDWSHLEILVALLAGGVAGTGLRLECADRFVELDAPIGQGMHVELGGGQTIRRGFVPDVTAAVALARGWLADLEFDDFPVNYPMIEQTHAPLDRLEDGMLGRFIIKTASGTRYLLDLDRRTLLRAPSIDDDPARLRRDGEQVDLLEIEHCVTGEEAAFYIDLHVPGVPYTLRRTTPVVSIRKAVDRTDERPDLEERS